jgi:hypothetical protein
MHGPTNVKCHTSPTAVCMKPIRSSHVSCSNYRSNPQCEEGNRHRTSICVGQDRSKGIQSFAWLLSELSPFRLRLERDVAVKATILGAFVKLQKPTISFVMSVRPSARNKLAPTGRIFMKLDVWGFSCREKMQVSPKSDKNNRYSTWTPNYIHDISENSF